MRRRGPKTETQFLSKNIATGALFLRLIFAKPPTHTDPECAEGNTESRSSVSPCGAGRQQLDPHARAGRQHHPRLASGQETSPPVTSCDSAGSNVFPLSVFLERNDPFTIFFFLIFERLVSVKLKASSDSSGNSD